MLGRPRRDGGTPRGTSSPRAAEVRSIATQTLVLFVIRTARYPLRSRSSPWLLATTLLVVAVGCSLPFTPLAHRLGFVALPMAYFLFPIAALTYLAVVEILKRRLIGRLVVVRPAD